MSNPTPSDRERASAIAKPLAAFANECCYRSDGYEEAVCARITDALALALAEQRSEIATKAESGADALRFVGQVQKAEALYQFAIALRAGVEGG